jgi:hypothetical protein
MGGIGTGNGKAVPPGKTDQIGSGYINRTTTTGLGTDLPRRQVKHLVPLVLIASFPPMQKSSGYGIGNLAEWEWRSSAGFRGAVADGFSA